MYGMCKHALKGVACVCIACYPHASYGRACHKIQWRTGSSSIWAAGKYKLCTGHREEFGEGEEASRSTTIACPSTHRCFDWLVESWWPSSETTRTRACCCSAGGSTSRLTFAALATGDELWTGWCALV